MRYMVLLCVVFIGCGGLLGCGNVDNSVEKPKNPTPMLDPSKRTGMGANDGESAQPKPGSTKSIQVPGAGN